MRREQAALRVHGDFSTAIALRFPFGSDAQRGPCFQLCYKAALRANQNNIRCLREGTAGQNPAQSGASTVGVCSGFVGGGDVGLRDEFCESDAGEDEKRAGGGTEAKALAGHKKGSDPCKDGFEREQERGVR